MINGGWCGTVGRQLAGNSGWDTASQPNHFLHPFILKLCRNKTAQSAKNCNYFCVFSFPVIKTHHLKRVAVCGLCRDEDGENPET